MSVVSRDGGFMTRFGWKALLAPLVCRDGAVRSRRDAGAPRTRARRWTARRFYTSRRRGRARTGTCCRTSRGS